MLYKTAIITLNLILLSAVSAGLCASGEARATRAIVGAARGYGQRALCSRLSLTTFCCSRLVAAFEKGGADEKSITSNFSSRRF